MCWQGGTTCNCQCRWAICPNHLVFGTLAIFVPLPCEIGASFSLTTTCGISWWGLRSLMPDENEPYLLNFGRGTNFFTHSIKSGTHSNAMVWILLAARQCFCMVTRDVEGKKAPFLVCAYHSFYDWLWYIGIQWSQNSAALPADEVELFWQQPFAQATHSSGAKDAQGPCCPPGDLQIHHCGCVAHGSLRSAVLPWRPVPHGSAFLHWWLGLACKSR